MQVHLVSFNVPYPPDYGGVIDVFYKIKTLHSLGIKVHLHCYTYGRPYSDELSNYCFHVSYYKRNTHFLKHFSTLPYIVNSRNSDELINDLNKDDYPVILEGLHCTFPLFAGLLNAHKTIVRTHNIEHEYYSGLAKAEHNIFKKAYFNLEAKKLKSYESVLTKATSIAAISPSDTDYFRQYNPNTLLITPFHPFNEVSIRTGKGNYILIHGDLSVTENAQSIYWLAKEVFPSCSYPIIIAGKNPSLEFKNRMKPFPHITFVANPDEQTMEKLVEEAHINLIHSFYPQGLKLKLLHALYKGRFCICNSSIVHRTGLESLCRISDTPDEINSAIEKLMQTPFKDEQIEERKKILTLFSNEEQAIKIQTLLNP
jgi:hypothetical protein